MPWFAVECKYAPDQVFDMPWPQLIQLTLVSDDMADQRRSAQAQQQLAERQARPMM